MGWKGSLTRKKERYQKGRQGRLYLLTGGKIIQRVLSFAACILFRIGLPGVRLGPPNTVLPES